VHGRGQAAHGQRLAESLVPSFSTWEWLGSEAGLLIRDWRGVLQPGALLLALLAVASVAVLVGAACRSTQAGSVF
jgi:hypothetical protein